MNGVAVNWWPLDRHLEQNDIVSTCREARERRGRSTRAFVSASRARIDRWGRTVDVDWCAGPTTCPSAETRGAAPRDDPKGHGRRAKKSSGEIVDGIVCGLSSTASRLGTERREGRGRQRRRQRGGATPRRARGAATRGRSGWIEGFEGENAVVSTSESMTSVMASTPSSPMGFLGGRLRSDGRSRARKTSVGEVERAAPGDGVHG